MEHPVLNRITRESFTPLGWFSPEDMGKIKFVILIGNAGPRMFQRFQREGGGVMAKQGTLRGQDLTKAAPKLAAELKAAAAFLTAKAHAPYLAQISSARGAAQLEGLPREAAGMPRKGSTVVNPSARSYGDRIGQAAFGAAVGRKSRALRPLNTVRRLNAPLPFW